MASKSDIQGWIIEVLSTAGRPMTVVEVSREVWQRHESELRASGDLFYTWQYDIRWEATKLRKKGVLAAAEGRRGAWSLIR